MASHDREQARAYAGRRVTGRAWRGLLTRSNSRRTLCVLALAAVLGMLSALGGKSMEGVHSFRTVASVRSGPGVQRIGRLDVHVDDLPSAPGLELDLSVTQSENDCGAPTHGQMCLRYSITQDDKPVQAGYGPLPVSQVTVHGAAISLATDTHGDPKVVRTSGAGGPISLTWVAVAGWSPVDAHASILREASVQGSVIGYVIPSTNVTAAMLIYGGS